MTRNKTIEKRRTATARNLAGRRGRRLLACVLLATAAFAGGCKALEDHKCPLFSEGGVFRSKKSEVEPGTSKDERDAIARAASETSNKKEAWEPTEAELAAARSKGINLKNYVWATQRPNGGALFPKEWQGPGPALVVEPSMIAAPVGTDIIVVASYIGEDSEYLRTGEELSWTLTGVGQFMESNPNEFAHGGLAKVSNKLSTGNCCLSKLFHRTSKEENSRNMTTSTTSQLWRINRGTETKMDDVTILRGQSWASVSAFEEGTSTIVIMSDSISSWDKRRAVAEIYWIDAAFQFPESGVGALNTTTNLSTTVCRRSTAEPRTGWLVRYDVLAGDAGVGPNREKSYTVQTDAAGAGVAQLAQLRGEPGTCKILATVMRPATENSRQVEVDKREIFYTWTQSAPITLTLSNSTNAASPGELISYQLAVNNLSDFYQNTTIELLIPKEISDFKSEQNIQAEANDGSWVRWQINTLPPRQSTTISFSLRKQTAGPIEIGARVVSAQPASPPTAGSSNAATNAVPSSAANPPVESRGQVGNVPAPGGQGVDPASLQPTL